MFNGASTIGPALAGITVDAIGLPANFYLNALSFLAVLWSLLAMRRLPGVARGLRSKLFGQIREALGTVRRDAVLPSMLLNYGTVLFFGPSLALLLPVLAIDRLHVSAGVLGILFSGAGLGAVAGGIGLGGTFAGEQEEQVVVRLLRTVGSEFAGGGIFYGGGGLVYRAGGSWLFAEHYRCVDVDRSTGAGACPAAWTGDEFEYLVDYGSEAVRRFSSGLGDWVMGRADGGGGERGCGGVCGVVFVFAASAVARSVTTRSPSLISTVQPTQVRQFDYLCKETVGRIGFSEVLGLTVITLVT